MSKSSKGQNTSKTKQVASGKNSKKNRDDENFSEEEEEVIQRTPVQQKATVKPKSKPAAAGGGDSDSDSEGNTPTERKPKSKKETKTNKKKEKEKEKEEEHSDDEDLDEERAAIGEDVMGKIFGGGGTSRDTKSMGNIDKELENMKLPSLSKLIPAKGMSKVIDSMTNDMLNNNNLDIDEIVEKSMEASGKKLSAAERNLAKQQASKLLSQLNPSIQTCTFLCKILLLGIKYSKPGKHGKGIGEHEGMREYHSLLSSTINNKDSKIKMKYANSHSETIKKLFEAYKENIREYQDHTWLETEADIVLTYGKNKTAVLPLSDIYTYISNLDKKHVARLEQNKNEKPEETAARREVENDAGELDHHLWKIFSLATDSQDEKTEYEDRALALVAGGDATKKDIVSVSRRMREKFTDDKSNYDANGEVIPAVLVGNVLNHLETTGELNSTIKNVISGIDKGNFDLMSTVAQAKRELLKEEETKKN